MPVTIRPFTATDADYEVYVQVMNAAHPECPRTALSTRERDEANPEHVRMQRFVAERDGVAVGIANWSHMGGLFHPRRLFVSASVLPDQQGRGIGRMLFDTALESVEAECEPVSLRSVCREDRPRAIRFLSDRGFEEDARGFESRLDLTTFDASRFDGAEQRVIASGIRLATLAEARTADEAEAWIRGIYEVDCEASLDIPAPEPVTMDSFAVWCTHVKCSRYFDEGMHIALDGDRVVGISMLFRATEPHMLNTGMTGVLRAYRRRGIALALKLRAAACAIRLGATMVRTHNDAPNRPMLSINEAMGYEKEPAYLDFYRSVRPHEDDRLARRDTATADGSHA